MGAGWAGPDPSGFLAHAAVPIRAVSESGCPAPLRTRPRRASGMDLWSGGSAYGCTGVFLWPVDYRAQTVGLIGSGAQLRSEERRVGKEWRSRKWKWMKPRRRTVTLGG